MTDDLAHEAEAMAAALLGALANHLGEAAAASLWRKVLADHARRRPRGQTELVLSLAWAVANKFPDLSNRELYTAVADFLAEKGRGRASNPDGPGSIARQLQRRFPAYRARKEAERLRRSKAMAERLLNDPADAIGLIFGLPATKNLPG